MEVPEGFCFQSLKRLRSSNHTIQSCLYSLLLPLEHRISSCFARRHIPQILKCCVFIIQEKKAASSNNALKEPWKTGELSLVLN